jgi:uncharacterized protein YbjT (DUF2867 family)
MAEPGMTVALTGSTGFVGRAVLRRLAAAGHRVRALVRDPKELLDESPRNLAEGAVLTPVAGDLFNPAALAELLRGAQAIVHLVGIIVEKPRQGQTFGRIHVEGTRGLLAAARDAGVARWVQMSALGTRPGAASTYHQTKWQAEELIRQSGLAATIFRPSVIHGPEGEFMRMIKGFWCDWFPPVVPYFGAGMLGRKGGGRVQPVWVEDVARCCVEAVVNARTIGQAYPLGGPDRYTFPELYRVCRAHLPCARRKLVLPLPVWWAKILAHLPGMPFNRDQVIMSQEDSVCELAPVERDFGFTLAAFEPTFAEYASRIG